MPLDRQKVRKRVIEIVEENISDRDVYNKAFKRLGNRIYNANLLNTGLDTLDIGYTIWDIQKNYNLDNVDINEDTLSINKLTNYVMKHAKKAQAAR